MVIEEVIEEGGFERKYRKKIFFLDFKTHMLCSFSCSLSLFLSLSLPLPLSLSLSPSLCCRLLLNACQEDLRHLCMKRDA